MPRGTFSANRAIFSEEKTARFLLVGENPKSPITHRWCGCASCGRFFFTVTVPVIFAFWFLPAQRPESHRRQKFFDFSSCSIYDCNLKFANAERKSAEEVEKFTIVSNPCTKVLADATALRPQPPSSFP